MLTDVALLMYPPVNRLLATSTFSTNAAFQINAAGYRIGFITQIPKTGVITKLGVRINTCASAVTSRIGLYTIGTDGSPTTTAYGGSTYGTFTPAANTFSEATLGSSAAGVYGDPVAIVVEFDSTAGDFYVTCLGGAATPENMGYWSKYNGTAWTQRSDGPSAMTMQYADGSYGDCQGVGLSSVATGNITSTTTPDEYALYFIAPFTFRAIGLYSAFGIGNANLNPTGMLYAGQVAVAQAPMNGKEQIRLMRFSSPAVIRYGTPCYASILPTNAFNLGFKTVTFASAAMLGGIGMEGAGLASRVDGGVWSVDYTSLPLIGVMIDQIDDGRRLRGRRGN